MFLKSKKYRFFIFAVSVVLFICCAAACATIVSPTGGPKDEKPPKLLKSDPKSGTTNFKGNKIVLSFDEYITLKDIEKSFIISPPLKNRPDIKVKGKSVVVKFDEGLRPNTTYNMFFGDAIVDNNENNPFKNYAFSFSTGNVIDTLSVSGRVIDAFTTDTVKDATVMLYNKFADSIPMKEIPVYVTRSNDKGLFTLRSLAQGEYKMIAVIDKNGNFMYDPNEYVGFISDNVHIKSRAKDSASYMLRLFASQDSVQRVVKYEMPSPEKLFLAFKYPTKSVTIKPLVTQLADKWGLQEWNATRDSLNIWLKEKSNNFSLTVQDVDLKKDTLNFISVKKLPSGNRKTNEKDLYNLPFYATLYNGKLGFEKDLIFTFSNPISAETIENIKINDVKAKRDVEAKINFTDSIKRNLLVKYAWQPDAEYKIKIPRSTFTDMYGAKNDSVTIGFSMLAREQYGTLKTNVKAKASDYPILIQLINEKGIVLRQESIDANKSVTFDLLAPNKYRLKAVIDRNHNNKWDTGNLLHKTQPEKVIIMPKIFDVRANWELVEDWDLEND